MSDLNNPNALLAHYTRAETAFAQILRTKQLLMNPYSKMRDPFENKRPHFRAASAWGDDAEAQNKMFWAIQREVSYSRDVYCLLSLTRGDDRPAVDPRDQMFRCPWSRARMWEQYAENHAGVCLLFDRDELLDTLRRELGGKGAYYEGEVKYTLGGFATSEGGSVMLDQFNEATLAEDVAIHVQRHYEDFFFLKTEDWATEFEYRFVWEAAEPPVPPSVPHFVPFRDSLRYVVVGEKFSEWQIPAAKQVAEAAGADLRRMTWELSLPWPTSQLKRQR